MKPFMAD